MDKESLSKTLLSIYHLLFERYGCQHWWPADEPFEVMIGAILTQSAAWVNVEKAIASLKAARALSPEALRLIGLPELAALIHPCGYYNAKARKLKALAQWLGDYCRDNLDMLSASSTDQLREQLLAIYGIGEETADSILLYAINQPVFVIDAYTRRIIDHIGLAPDRDRYSAYHTLFMDNLPADVRLFNEYHALLVRLGKDACRKRPLCQKCCLGSICNFNTEGTAVFPRNG